MPWASIVSTGVAAFLGVLAGIIVNIATHYCLQRKEQVRQLQNVRFEIQLTINKIGEWLSYVQRFKECVASDTPDLYYGYFDFSKVPTPALNSLYKQGILYKYLDLSSVAKLLEVDSKRTVGYEQEFNRRVIEHLDNFEKKEALKQAGYWETGLKDDQKKLEEVLGKFP